MRPRFSLKWLLILFALFAFALYFCFVRPTALANKFVYLVDHDELERAESLIIASSKPFDLGTKDRSVPVIVRAELLPRTWHDVFKMQRRLDVEVIPTRPQVINSVSYYQGMHYQATAGISTIRGSAKYYLAFEGVEKLIEEREARQEQ